MVQPKKVLGKEIKCPECGDLIVCRMTNYPGDKYKNYEQWQNKYNKEAHYKNGCNRDRVPGPEETAIRNGTNPVITTRTPRKVTDEIIQKVSVPDALAEMHKVIWDFSNEQAKEIWPEKIKSSEGFPDVDVNEKSRNILAQVFYKCLMPTYLKMKYKV